MKEYKTTGKSLILGRGICYYGDYSRGLWFDSCTQQDQPEGARHGWGIKIDLAYNWVVRPMAYLLKLWTNQTLIGDIKLKDYDKVFGKELGDKIKQVMPEVYRKKHKIYNPWYAIHKSVSRSNGKVWRPFISIGTPWRNFYLGWKPYTCDPKCGNGHDMTWTNDVDEERAKQNNGDVEYLCLSATSRSSRD